MATEAPRITTGRLAAAVVPAAVLPFLGALIYFVFYAGESWARWTYVAVKVFTLVWPIVATLFVLRRPLPRPNWRSPVHRRALPLGALVGGGMVAGAIILFSTPVGDAIFAFAPQIRTKVGQLGVLEHYGAFALFLSIIHSGLEEYYWRWFVYGNLRPVMGPAVGAVVASIAFTSHHVVILTQYVSLPWVILGSIAILVGGLIWCWMYQRQGTLAGAWLAHILADLVILGVGYRVLFGG